MMEQPVKLRRTSWLDLPLTQLFTIDRALLVLGVILLLAVGSRFWELGSRALHHDESLHAVYSYYLYESGHYQHEPLMHGPVLFHLTAVGFWLFGASDFTVRLVPALLGLILVWFPWRFRDWLGTRGALATSALLLISPSVLYYSRFIREDIFAVVWTVVIVYGMWRYMDRGRDFDLYLMVAGWALLFSQKEISFLLAFVFWTFLALIFALRYTGHLGPRVEVRRMREWHLLVLLGALLLPFTAAVILHLPAFLNKSFGLALPVLDPGIVAGNSETSVYNRADSWSAAFNLRAYLLIGALFGAGAMIAARLWNGRKFLVAAAVFYTIFILFHTTFFTNIYGIGSGMVGALGYWIEQHEVQRGEQPWYYYMLLLPLYEFLPLLLGLGGGLLLLARGRNGPLTRQPPGDPFHLDARSLWPYFNLWWFAGAFILLSVAGEKMPWLLIHQSVPLIFLAGWAMGRFLDALEWETIREEGGLWFALLFLLQLIATFALAWMILQGRWPFRDGGEGAALPTLGWTVSLLFLLGSTWAGSKLGERLGSRAAQQVGTLALVGLLSLATIRFAWIASFINGDIPHEPLIFVQSSPSVPMVKEDIDAISQRMTGGKELVVAYDNFTSWPFEWYLREYRNKVYYGDSPQGSADRLREASVILVGWKNEEALKPFVTGYIRHEYPMRWWFPEEYKKLVQNFVVEPDPSLPGQATARWGGEVNYSPLNVMQNIWKLAQQPQYRADFFDFLLNRKVQQPLGGENFIVYIKPEVVNEVWRYRARAEETLPAAAVAPEQRLGGPALLTSPKDVALLPDGRLVVADGGNHRLVVLAPDGTVEREIGGQGNAPGQFNEPWGVAAAPDGTIYVADTWNHRIQHLTVEGELLNSWGGFADTVGQMNQPGLFWGPRDVAVDGEGRVYVTDTGNKRVQIFEADGSFVGQFGGAGSAPGQLAEPVGITVAEDGTIWVVDTWNQRIQGFAADFTPLVQLPLAAWAGENITNKPYIAAGEERLWVTDPEQNRIVELDWQGNVLRTWGTVGEQADRLALPLGLAFDGERLWVADSQNQRVLGYKLEAVE